MAAMLQSMAERHSFERVDSLFAHLDAVERKLADNQQAFLRALDDKYSATGLGPLQEEAQELSHLATAIVREIEAHVADSSAHAVFTGRRRAQCNGGARAPACTAGEGRRSGWRRRRRRAALVPRFGPACGCPALSDLLVRASRLPTNPSRSRPPPASP